VTAPPVAAAAIGLDLGGTKVLGVLLDAHGAIQRDLRRPTPDGAEPILDVLDAVATELADPVTDPPPSGRHLAIGIGAPGLITLDGVLVSSPNLPGVTDLHLGEALSARLGAPVAVSNDATCAALAEWRVGAGRGVDDLVMVTLGTGIGGGVVAGGRLLTGAHGFTGEFGHMVVDPEGVPCPCGRRGCWERYASGSGLAALAQRAAGEGRLDRVLALAGGTTEEVRGEHVHRAATEGDAGALEVVEEFARWVALGLANLTNAFDPAAFVLGGGLAEGSAVFLGPIRRWYHDLLYASDRRPRPELAFAELGEHAGAIGAALLALDRQGA
jgi:glucokinase